MTTISTETFAETFARKLAASAIERTADRKAAAFYARTMAEHFATLADTAAPNMRGTHEDDAAAWTRAVAILEAPATHYLIFADKTAHGVVAADEADALRQADAMGVRDAVVRVDEAMTPEAFEAALQAPKSAATRTRHSELLASASRLQRVAALEHDSATFEMRVGSTSRACDRQADAARYAARAREALFVALDIAALARAFSRQLAEDIGADDLATAVAINATPDYQTTGACASHDFCDANMTMLGAWETTFGDKPAFLSDSDDAASLALWNEAWTLAKASAFFTISR